MVSSKIKNYLLLLIALSFFFGFTRSTNTKMSGTYELVNDWLKLPKDFHSGQVSGIGIDTSQNIIFFQRTDRRWTNTFPDSLISSKTIFTIDRQTGKILNSWGANLFIMPHGLTVDKQNNIWVTDVALQQVFKFSHEGKLLLTLGVAKTEGNDSTHFTLPTDVAVTKNGSCYVSDGYGNSRIVKFDKNGHYLFEWGKKGTGEGEFDVPHSIHLDNYGNVYVADRENNRIQKFDGNGKFLKQWKNNEANKLYAVSVGKSNSVFAIDDLFINDSLPGGDAVMKFDSKLNLRLRFGRNDSTLNKYYYYHDIEIDNLENIYVANMGDGARVQKFRKISK